ncbi:hypothetical protein [Methanobrevibacter sp.]|uniref:hypothetical protein n=1 Tax=Methanobrevibacter sp. TaxID=66852 RepID=UPI002E78748F|nr:hypothetical protein [Methanobrevibacter sp.]MEE1337298.1 hypothetical protein [Methanobrevibacter sp.]
MKDIKLELMMVAALILILFNLFDFTYCLITYDVITYQYSLGYRIITVLIPIIFIISVIIKIIRWDKSFGDILFSAYIPLIFWAFTMAFCLPLSLVFAGVCKGIIMLGM